QIAVEGIFTGIPGGRSILPSNLPPSAPRATTAPSPAPIRRSDNLVRDPLQPDSAVRNAADLTGSGRTGNAPVRLYTYTFKVIATARITVDGKTAKFTGLRPDLFVRVTARPGTIEAVGTGPVRERPIDAAQTGISGANTGDSPARNVAMMAEIVEGFTA